MKKKTVQKLENTDFFQSVCSDTCEEAIISTNHAMEIKSWNKGAERIYGLRKEEVMEKNLTDVIGFGFVRGSLSSFLCQLTDCEYWEGEVMYINKDRVLTFTRVSVSAVKDPMNAVIGYVAIVREEAATDSAHTAFKPIFDAEFGYVGLVNTDSEKGWEMVLHWHE